MLFRQHEFLLEVGLIDIGLDILDMDPDIMVQIEMEHQNEGMDGNLAEQILADRLLLRRDLVLFRIEIALRRLAQIAADNIAGQLQRQGAIAEQAFVIDQSRRVAARRQNDRVLARPVIAAMLGGGVFGEKAQSAARELCAIARAPIEIIFRVGVIGGDQLRRLAEQALGCENLGHRLADDLAR